MLVDRTRRRWRSSDRGTLLWDKPINGSACAQSWPASKLCGTYLSCSVETIQVSRSGPVPGSSTTPETVSAQAAATDPAV